MKKTIKAWAVLQPVRDELSKQQWPGFLAPYGNGNQFQYPIFHLREEARAWRAEDNRNRGKIVRIEIIVP
jgi:hypothetical protein